MRWVLTALLAGLLSTGTACADTVGNSPGDIFRDCADCPEMVVVPAGEFMMGSPDGENHRSHNEGPQRRVTIPRAFAVGRYEVTFVEWDACVADGGCPPYWEGLSRDEGWGRGSRPAVNVNWDDTQSYVSWLSRKTGQTYRLLSEAEWEYAARAGTTTAYPWGDTPSHEQMNYAETGGRDQWVNTSPVDSFPPNAFGLYDMAGNASEWVQDCLHEDYTSAPTNGSAWTSGNCWERVLRGGSWTHYSWAARSAFRSASPPISAYGFIGFRLARTLGPQGMDNR